ncbi:MAG: hypothetical protein II789_01640 [Clostridia bacterium]|nr:hypothetical protein [Clostridia bacterium]
MKKKVLLLLLPVLLIAAAMFTVKDASVFAAYTFKAYDTAETHEPMRVENDDSVLGQRVHVNGEFTAFGFNMPTWNAKGSLATLAVYKWDNDFDTTLEGEPLFSKNFKCQDNALNQVRFKDTPLGPGEYFFAIYNTEGPVGCYYIPNNNVSKGFCYNNGLEQEWDLELTIVFTSREDEPVLECKSASESYTSVKPPKEYVIPSDSLIYTHEVMPDTWVFTDGLGRTSLTYADVGAPRDGKTLALFYWTWHNSERLALKPFNNTLFCAEHPEVLYDYHNPLWPTGATGHFWNESVYGYYISTDDWVLRKHAELLADAGVDVVFTDNTNGTATWRECYQRVFATWSQAMQDGVRTPKLSFMLPFGANDNARTQLQMLFTDVFKPQLHPELWFYWEGKPMLMAWPGKLRDSEPMDRNIKSYFTFRNNEPDYLDTDSQNKLGHWGWLSMYPQAYYFANAEDKEKGIIEQVTVGVAQNHNYKTHKLSAMNGPYNAGRSYTLDESHLGEPNSKLYGYNLAEQFEYALTLDPKVIFVTGWNELTVGRYEEWGGVKNAFPDQFDDENSRDIEPSRGELRDNYYYQLVNFVRRYKGARPIPAPSDPVNIDLKGGSEQWQDVKPYYAAYIGNTGHRDALGYGRTEYKEFSGRNDIIGAQLARDNDFFYFRVECRDTITPYTDKLWMNLYIDSDQDNQGWESFDYILNKTAASDKTAVLERFTGNGYDSEKVADCEYVLDGHYLTVKVRKSDLGVSGDKYTVNFAWTDNVHDLDDTGENGVYSRFSGEILEFYVSGDVAPGGRFKYSYIVGEDPALPSGNTDNKENTENKALTALLIILPCVAAITAVAAAIIVIKRRRSA